MIAGPGSVRPSRELERAFTEACHRRSAEPLVEAGTFSEGHGEHAAGLLLDRAQRPTALISGFSQILPGVLRAVRTRGLRIPQDVSLVTFDELPMLEFVTPPIATVSRDPLAIGREAARILLERLDGAPPANAVIPTQFTERGSCAPPP